MQHLAFVTKDIVFTHKNKKKLPHSNTDLLSHEKMFENQKKKKQELYCCDFIKQGSVPKPKKNVSLATYKQTKHKGISVTFLVIIIVYVVSYLKFLLIQIHSFIAKSQFIDIGYRLKIYFVCIRLNLLNHIKKNIISICLTTSNFGKN